MPTFEYECPTGHCTTDLRPYAQRDEPLTCACGLESKRIFSAPHVPVDGIYSYSPNIGSANDFERKQAKIRGEISDDAK